MSLPVAILVFFLPLVFLPSAALSFEIPKVFVFEIAAIILFFAHIFKGHQFRFKWRQIAPYLVVALLPLTHLGRLQIPQLLFGDPFRLQGSLLLWSLLCFSLIGREPSQDRNWLSRFAPISLILLALSTLLLADQDTSRAVGTLGEANALAAAINFIWPFIVISPNRLKMQKGFFYFIALLTIGLSGSRSGLLAFSIQTLLIAATRHLRTRTLSLLAGVILLASYGLPFIEAGRIFENRLEVWQTALVAGWQRPLTGHGFGNLITPFQTTAELLQNNLRFQLVDSAHNLWLDWWLQGGFLGLICLIWLTLRTIRRAENTQNCLNLTLLFGLLTSLSFNPSSVVTLVQLWWLLGQDR